MTVGHQLLRRGSYKLIVWAPAISDVTTGNGCVMTSAKTVGAEYVLRLCHEDKTQEIRRILASAPVLILLPAFDQVADSGMTDFLSSLPDSSQSLLSLSTRSYREWKQISRLRACGTFANSEETNSAPTGYESLLEILTFSRVGKTMKIRSRVSLSLYRLPSRGR